MTRLFNRTAKVTLITPSALPNAFFDRQPGRENAIEISDLRIEFSIEKSIKTTPNKCEVVITNLAERSRNLVEKKPLQIWFDAGYDGVLHQLFTGDVRYAYSKLDRPEWKTVIQLGDGDRALRMARINRSYSSGTPILTAVRDTTQAMGLTLSANDQSRLASLQIQFLNPKATQGYARDELTRLLAPHGIGWSIQNGKLQLLKDDEVTEGQAVLITADNGMIETPEFTTPTKPGKSPALKLKTLLDPRVSPGILLEVHSRAIKGRYFRTQRVVHKGDTHGSDWTTEIEAIPVELRANSEASIKHAETPDGAESPLTSKSGPPGTKWLQAIKSIGTKH